MAPARRSRSRRSRRRHPVRRGATSSSNSRTASTTLSDGKITIDVLDSAATEREAVESVQDGTADIGVVPARIFDTMDVTTVRALQAPFLIDSNALADAVLADPLAGEMLAGLDDVGLTGLALTFDSLRHPVGTTEPLLEPADFDGAVIAMLPGATQQADYTALGAEVTHAVDAELTVGIAQGRIQGRDGSMQVPVGATTGPITGNAVIYLKALAVVADSATFDGLTPEQQDVLRQAAAGTRDWASAQHTPLADAASAYCADGLGDVVLASDDQLAALRSAVEPVYAELDEDEFTQAAIERIQQLKASIVAGAGGDGLHIGDDGVGRVQVGHRPRDRRLDRRPDGGRRDLALGGDA